jgi:glycosyltransferase involved in cell wall biosynthesis
MTKKLQPLISIIIPAFNAQASIQRAVSSVLNQTYRSTELIVINDCSSDDTPKVLEGFLGKNNKITVIENKINKGVAAARNQGIDAANGDWITFLDADDFFDRNYLEKVHNFFRHQEFVCTSYVQIETSNEKKHNNHQMTANTDLHDEALLDYMELYFLKPYQNTAFVHCWNKFFLKNLIEKHALRFNESLNQLEDVDFVFSYLYHADRRKYIHEPGVFHHVDKLGHTLSNLSGLEENSLHKIFTALEAPKKLKKKLLFKCQKVEAVPFEHFFSSMVLLFCIRITRQIWHTRRLALFRNLWHLLAHPQTKKFSSDFRFVEGESKLITLSFRHFPTVISSILLLLIRR